MARREKKTGLIAVRLEPDIIAAIETQADREDRPTAAMARILIKEALAAREGKKKSEWTTSPRRTPRS
jgi:hypothetical protein